MRVILLGTGASAGVPLIGGEDGSGDWGACDPSEPRNRRTRTSIVVESDSGMRLLVDTAPELREQLLACRVPRVDAVLYTHAHADHITGIDDVRILNRIAGRPLDAFATKATLEELTRRFGYAFRPWQPPGFFRPVLVAREITAGETIEAADMQVRLFEQDHGFIPSLGLRIGELRLFDRRREPGRCGARRAGGRGYLGGRLLPAPRAAQDACGSGAGADVGAPRRSATDGADAHGHRYGLELAGGEPAGGHRAGSRWHGA